MKITTTEPIHMSSLAQYYHAGQQAGKARNRHDESLCQHHTEAIAKKD